MLNKLKLRDSIGLAIEKLEDAQYLIQEIRENFFENFNPDKQEDLFGLTI